MALVRDDGDRAVLDPGGDGAREDREELLGASVGADVPVVGVSPPEEQVAHAAPDDPRPLAARAEALAEGEHVGGDAVERDGVVRQGHPLGLTTACDAAVAFAIAMLDFTDDEKLAQSAIRSWCTQHLEPKVRAMETGELPIYPTMREMAGTFGIPDMARAQLAKMRERAGTGRSKKHHGGVGERGAPRPG